MADIGTAYVQIVPKATGITGMMTAQMGGASVVAGKKSGMLLGGTLGRTAMKALGGIGIATGIGSIVTKGWDRMSSIDNAKAKLSALGNTQKDVAKISQNAMDSVRGTAYGYDESMTVAASATAAGIKPGKELAKYLTLVGDTAAVAGISMGEMGSIFNKVAANGKVTTEEMNQLADRGIPIWQLLAKETGMSMDELRSAVSNGAIDLKTFQGALEQGMGGAAKKMGTSTISGAIANINASLSRMGANLLGSADDADSFAGRLLPLFNNLMGFMGKIEEGAKVLGQVIGSILGPILDGLGQVFTKVGEGSGSLAPLKDLLIQIGNFIGQVIIAVMPIVMTLLEHTINKIKMVMDILNRLKPVFSAIFSQAKTQIQILMPIINGIMNTVGAVVDFITGKISFTGLVKKVGKIWKDVKKQITEPLQGAKDKVMSIINTIKSKFPFNIGKIIKMKLPKIELELGSKTVLGKTIKYPKGFNIHWAAKGGIVDGATLIGAGEAGAEAIVPLDPFWDRLENSNKIDYGALATALVSALSGLSIENNMVVDGRTVASATAPFIESELNKRTARNNRKLGFV